MLESPKPYLMVVVTQYINKLSASSNSNSYMRDFVPAQLVTFKRQRRHGVKI